MCGKVVCERECVGHGEDGRGAWARCKCRLNSENAMQRQHVTSNAGDSVFQPVRNQCVRNAVEVLMPRFLELKDRCEGKLLGRPQTTSSLARTYFINTHPFF